MGIDDAFGERQFNKTIPAIILVYSDFADILALTIGTLKHERTPHV
jgi:hypothetical protein